MKSTRGSIRRDGCTSPSTSRARESQSIFRSSSRVVCPRSINRRYEPCKESIRLVRCRPTIPGATFRWSFGLITNGKMMTKRLTAFLLFFFFTITLSAQDWIRTGTGLGVEKIRLAAPDFKPITTDTGTQNLALTFDTTFQNDLQAAGIFDMVSRSFFPLSVPGAPQEVHLADWSSPPS